MKNSLTVSALSAALLAACAQDVVNSYDEAKDKAKITISVLDGNSNEPIENASVQSQFDKDSKKTDVTGYVIYEGEDIGTYIFDISKKDYASVRTVVDVVETGANDVSRVPDVATTVTLYKANVTISGKVYYVDSETGNMMPAKEVSVILSYPTEPVFPSEMVAKTNKDGEYEFKNVAEKVDFTVEAVQSTILEKVYSSRNAVSGTGVRSGTSKMMDKIVMIVDGETPTLLNSNLTDLNTESSLKLEFSVPLTADSVLGKWNVLKGSSSVLTKASLSNDGKTLTITPVSGSWSENASYTISGKGYSKDGFAVTVDKGFSVGSVSIPGQVSDLVLATDSTDYDEEYSDTYNFNNNIYMKLSWKAPKSDVSGYKIYYKTNEMDDFVYYAETTTTSYSKVLGDLSLAITTAKTVSFYVLPYNAAGMADASDAKSVTWTVVK